MADTLAFVTVCVVYVLVMIYLATGLRILRRAPRARPQSVRPQPVRPHRRGWPGLILQVVSTYLGGWLLLMLVILGYYGGLARHSPGFVLHAITGTLLLMGLTLPLFLALTWLATRPAARRRRGRRSPGGRDAARP
ncbi:DUF6256 family protein [Streptomyces carpaticus]|uniref:DUF6256 family protein n=1 Tax=Streptomyces carpaticus TaxID=285558 RepID=UPI0031F92411